VFFMTSSLYREDAMLVEVSLPPVGEGLTGGASNAVYINVDDEDRIFHGDIEYDLPTLRTTLVQLHEQFPNEAVVVRGDKGASHGRVMEVRDAAAEAKFTRVYYGVVKKGSELTQ